MECNNPNLFICTYEGEVKITFTELPHEEIIKSIKLAMFMLRKTKIGRSKHSVTFNLNDKLGCRIRRSYDDQNTVKVKH